MCTRLRPVIVGLFILLLAGTAWRAAAPAHAQDLLLKNTRIVDPETKTVTRGAIVIREGLIAEVPEKAPANFDGKVLDLNGKWVLPGLNDLHVHSYGNLSPTGPPEMLGTEGAARRMLYAGVTGFLDLANFEGRILALRDRQRTEGLLGADIYAAGAVFTCPDGHGTEYPMPAHVVESPKEARREVQALVPKEPDAIKVIYNPSSEHLPSMDRPTMEAIIEEAKAAGIKTVVHIGAWSDALPAVKAGANAITHAAPAPVPDRLLTLMKKQGTYAIPTLAVHTELAALARRPERLDAPLLAAVAAKRVRTAYRDTSAFPQGLKAWMQHQAERRTGLLEAVRTLHQHDIPLVAGTDAGNPGVFQGYSLHRELALLVKAGLSSWEALAAATTQAGRFLGEPLGVTPGDRANLVVLTASPLDDIRHTQEIARVIYRGRAVEREQLLKPSGHLEPRSLSTCTEVPIASLLYCQPSLLPMILRRLSPLLIAFFLASTPAVAQPVDSLIAQGKRMLQTGYEQGDAGTLQQAQSRFLRAAERERRSALARYYAGLAGYRLLSSLDDESRQMKVLNDAITHLEAATEAAPKMADAHALLSALYGWKAGQQWHKAMFLGPKASDAMARAKKLAPQNPRVVFLDAVGLYNKPSMFGGDKKKALKGFKRAAQLAAQETATDPLAPNWGRADALAWAGVAHMKAGRSEKARTAFRKALRANPDFGWVKDVLMPKLAEASK